MELEDSDFVYMPFNYLVASLLFGNYSFLEEVTVNPDICRHANLGHMADLLDEEAEK